MKLSGWIFMIFSWTMILSLATFCFSRILKKGLGSGNLQDRKSEAGQDKEKENKYKI